MKTADHVARFLDDVDHQGAILAHTTDVLKRCVTSSATRRSLVIAEAWLLDQARRRYGADFDPNRPPDDFLREASEAAALFYLSLEKRPARRPLRPRPSVVKRLSNLDDDFVPTLMNDCHRRQQEHPDFAADLGRVVGRIEASLPELDAARKDLADSVAGTDKEDQLPGVVFMESLAGPALVIALVIVVGLWLWDQYDRESSLSDPDDGDDE